MKKNIITSLVVLGAIAVIAVILMKNKEANAAKIAVVAEKNATVSVKVAQVKTEEMSLDFSSNGNFEPVQELTVCAEKSGKVISILVKEGDRVSVGQTIAIVRSDVINVEAQTAEAAYQNALTDYNRFENAYKTGGVTKQQLDQARLGMVNAKARLTQARINVGDTRIKAPISGIINKRFIEPGSILAGMPPTQMFEIVNVSKLKLKVTANESQIAGIKVGNVINVTSNVYPGKTFSGKITFVAPKADTSLNFPVEIEITNNASNDLKAGMYGTAQFSSNQQKQNLMVVPRNAFVGSVSSNQIFVNENGVAVLKNVVAGRILGDKVEIVKGLNNGDQVVVTGQLNIVDGTKLEIIK
ncbi:efflux RND transporter periplasmic adaptor subunit [Flavobacterium urocaniciphilum]|uniref:RND family efflux transporter, MFP subunit n=1 Tax=Flavobacterium urocaniciphilum TaxID=1299341 RepID=A0A1H9DXA5_9FLAO|nr:efflux RND transporter periplasmic adaptor subunit [Flavobacterium urocaniciphilum]SEQ17523.1 RND family efflux transporter, MFP subunit [Flavobacterium urocaniciphilum]